VKKLLIILGILIMSLSLGANSNATTTFFDFEDGIDKVGELGGLENYLTAKFGGQVSVVPISASPSVGWRGKDGLFNNSDVLYTLDAGGTLDFDPGVYPSGLKITQISFTWGVFTPTLSNNLSFGLDIFDDISNTWINNVFAVKDFRINTGYSGPIIIGSGLKVTGIRFHDDGARDVGLDDLTIVDNRDPEDPLGVPEASMMNLLGSGLIGLWGFRRRFGK
jgi:hypothetical protein